MTGKVEVVGVEIDELGYVLIKMSDGVIYPEPLTIKDIEKLKRDMEKIEENVRKRKKREDTGG